ncbi:MAG TPA: crossover junction endodeoxyribonuclease RuvC [Candidatus Babeliales bacterium]|nr:crossover junction endodeoxyribonuclease RuvC [Candidatus Babeliales bacterium]
MIVLGIDPGLLIAGFAIIKKEQKTTYLLDAGYLKLPGTKTVIERVGLFHEFFEKKIIEWKVTDLAIETPFLGKNSQTFLKLGYLRGILYLLTHKHSLQLHEFSPREVKQSITGFGGAGKEQVARVLYQLFPRLIKPEKYDVTDALAVTLCGLWKTKNSYLL